MKVLLVNEAEYEIKEEAMKRIPFDVFDMLKDDNVLCEDYKNYDKVRVFKNMNEYNRMICDEMKSEFDTSKDVLISNKGNIFLFLKKLNTDVTTNSQES